MFLCCVHVFLQRVNLQHRLVDLLHEQHKHRRAAGNLLVKPSASSWMKQHRTWTHTSSSGRHSSLQTFPTIPRSRAFRETSLLKVGSLVCAWRATKGAEQPDPSEYRRLGPAEGREGGAAPVCQGVPGRVLLFPHRL